MHLAALPLACVLSTTDAAADANAPALAQRIPADALLYAAFDSRRFVDGCLGLGVTTLLDEQQVRDFLQPLAADLPVEVSTAGLRQFLDRVPWRDYVDGRVEIAVRGLEIEVGGQRLELSASKPLDARTLNRLGAIAHHAESGTLGQVRVSLDAVAGIEAGPRFEPWLDAMLDGMRDGVAALDRSACRVGGREATRVTLRVDDEAPATAFWIAREGGRCWIAGSEGSLERALAGAQGETLARSGAFQRWRAQVASETPALELWLNVAHVARIFERLVPPIVTEELDLLGFTAIESLGFASSFVGGGVRDSLAISWSKPPTGLLSLLDCTEGGFDSLKFAPAETGLFLGLRVAPEAFLDKLVDVAEQLVPGASRGLDQGIDALGAELGMDVREQLLAALGDEVGVWLTPPGAGSMLPDGMVRIEVGDREQFEKLLGRALAMAAEQGVQCAESRGFPEGCRGWTVTLPDAPVQPAIALTQDALCISPNILSLKSALKAREGARGATALDNATLQSVLAGLTGKRSAEGLSLLAFVDLRQLVALGYQFVPMVAGQIAEATEGRVDPANLPESDVVASHFTGIGIAGRSDRHGLSLSFFSPTGIAPLGAMAAAATHLAPMAAPVAVHEARRVARPAATARSAPPAPQPAKEPAAEPARSLATLFANLEKATGATIDYPESLAAITVDYRARSGDLATILAELADLVGFRYDVREVDGAPLVVITAG